jgi:exopolyphosphatase/guanosine-5'-triphosphate,3'-diphosphate pyrophosphatase
MDLYGVTELEICPWALREGVILRKLDVMAADTAGAASAGGLAGDTHGSVAKATPGFGPPGGGNAATVARRDG